MKFKDYLTNPSVDQSIEDTQLNEAIGAKVAKRVLDAIIKGDSITFDYTTRNIKTETIKTAQFKIDSDKILDLLSGQNQMWDLGFILNILKGDSATINTWKKYILSNSFKFTFNQKSFGGRRIPDLLYTEISKNKFEYEITEVSFDGIVFYTEANKIK